MKKIFLIVFMLCLLLAACSKGAGDVNDKADKSQQGNATKAGESVANTGEAAQDEGPTAQNPLTLYPAYLQTPRDMPVVLEAETYPQGKKLTWISANPAVATVDAEGCVTPVGAGETTITCQFAEDANVSVTCGVLVVEEGKILLYEYPFEPVDLETIAAQRAAEKTQQASNEPGEPWPDAWPGDLPRLDGKVIWSYGEAVESVDGLQVAVEVAGLDAAKAYVAELVALGLKSEQLPGGEYNVALIGKGYDIHVSYTESDQLCQVLVKG